MLAEPGSVGVHDGLIAEHDGGHCLCSCQVGGHHTLTCIDVNANMNSATW